MLPDRYRITVQAAASGRLQRANTAYADEALYLRAGRAEWAIFCTACRCRR